MTNPGSAIGTNGAFGGRTSPNALNDVLSAYTRGILSGWKCVPSQGLTVSLGGDGVNRDVAIAEDPNGNRLTIDNRSEGPVEVTLSAAPAVGERIDAIVAYINSPPEGTISEADNPGACGLIVVEGAVSSASPTVPTESEIRNAIGLDGGSSTQAYYVVMATILVTEGISDITSSNITDGDDAIPHLNPYLFNLVYSASRDHNASAIQIGNTGTTILSVSVPAGKYVVTAGCEFIATNGGSIGETLLQLVANSREIPGSGRFFNNGGSNYWFEHSTQGYVELSSPTEISLVSQCPTNVLAARSASLIALKVG